MGLSYFIFGASTGIGYELVKQYSDDPTNIVIGTIRAPNAQLEKLQSERKNVHAIKVDVFGAPGTVETLAKNVSTITSSLDVVICNAGSIETTGQKILDIEPKLFARLVENNVATHVAVTKELYQLLKADGGGKLAFTSSAAGLVQSNDGSFSSGAYGTSKAALNFVAKSLSFELKNDGIIVLPFHPGLVKTDIALEFLDTLPTEAKSFYEPIAITTEESVAGIIKLIAKATPEMSGKFFLWNGEEHDF